MALDTDNFLPMSAQANSDAPRFWSYGTSDAIATVEAANYFDDSFTAGVTLTGDVLLCQMSDGTKFYKLTTDRDAGTVTISTGTAIT